MKYRALIVGAGRIGAAFDWPDDEYSHAGAYRALSDRVELVGFVEPDAERRRAAEAKWQVPTWDDLDQALEDTQPDIASVCVQPRDQCFVLEFLDTVKGVWCEKPYLGGFKYPVPFQVNFLRRADPEHRRIAAEMEKHGGKYSALQVTAKNDIHTWCHFSDLAKWWKVETMIYRPTDGPCSYRLTYPVADLSVWHDFPNGGINAAECMKGMLANLLDHIEGKAELYSPPY